MKFILTLLFLSMSLLAQATLPDFEKLSPLLQKLDETKADFVQHTFDGKGDLLQTQKGQLQLKFPNKFRWKSVEPYAQLLVSNGSTLWQYDEDLEQVTVQVLDQRVSATPALLLSGSFNDIKQEYDVYAEKLQDEMHFVLIPKSKDVLFDRLRLEFAPNGLLTRMTIKDEVGQKTIIRLLNIQTNVGMSAQDFEFKIPEGTDVIKTGE